VSGSVVASDVLLPAVGSLNSFLGTVPSSTGAPFTSGYLFPLPATAPAVLTFSYDPLGTSSTDTFADTLQQSPPYWAQLSVSVTGYVTAYSITCVDPSSAPTAWFVEFADASGFPYLLDTRSGVSWASPAQTQYFALSKPSSVASSLVLKLTSTDSPTVQLAAVGVYTNSNSVAAFLSSNLNTLVNTVSGLSKSFSQLLCSTNVSGGSATCTLAPNGYPTSYTVQCGDPLTAPTSWTVTAFGAGGVFSQGLQLDSQSDVRWFSYGEVKAFGLPGDFLASSLVFSFPAPSTSFNISVFADPKTAVSRLDQKLTLTSTLISGYNQAKLDGLVTQGNALTSGYGGLTSGLSIVVSQVSGLASSISGVGSSLNTLSSQVAAYTSNVTFQLPPAASAVSFILQSPDPSTWGLVTGASPPLPFWDALSLSVTGAPTFYTLTCDDPSTAPTQWSVLVYDQSGGATVLASVSGVKWSAAGQTQTFSVPSPALTVGQVSLAWTSATPSTVRLRDASFYSDCANFEALATRLCQATSATAASLASASLPVDVTTQARIQAAGILTSGSVTAAGLYVGSASIVSDGSVVAPSFATPSGFLVSGGAVEAPSFATPSGFLVSGGCVEATSFSTPSGFLVSGGSVGAVSFSTPSGFLVSGGCVGAPSFSTPSGFLVSGGCVGAPSFSTPSGFSVSGGSVGAVSFSTPSGFSVSGGSIVASSLSVDSLTVNSSFRYQRPFLQMFTSGFSVNNNQTGSVTFTTTEASSVSGYLSVSGASFVNVYGSPVVANVSYTMTWATNGSVSGYLSSYLSDGLSRSFGQSAGFSNSNGLVTSGSASIYLSASGYFRLNVSVKNTGQSSLQALGVRLNAFLA